MKLHTPSQATYDNLKNNGAAETTNIEAFTKYQVLDARPPEITKEYQGLVTDTHTSVELAVPQVENAYENSKLQEKSPNNNIKGQSLYEEVKAKI